MVFLTSNSTFLFLARFIFFTTQLYKYKVHLVAQHLRLNCFGRPPAPTRNEHLCQVIRNHDDRSP